MRLASARGSGGKRVQERLEFGRGRTYMNAEPVAERLMPVRRAVG